jgi:quercetin dioxygenase-like cupin family protein
MTENEPRHHDTNWAEQLIAGPAGTAYAKIRIGRAENAPSIYRAEFPPHCEVSPHYHNCDYAEIILEGEQQVGRKTYRVGDIRVVNAETVYGPLIAGPEGAVVLVIMANSNDAAVPPKHGKPVTVGGVQTSPEPTLIS